MINTKTIEKTLTPEENADRQAIQEAADALKETGKIFLMKRLAFAFLLITMKIKHKKRFYSVIDEDIISKKQVERTMKLLLDKDVDFKSAMSNKGGSIDLENNVAMLKVDERVKALTTDGIENLNQPTLKKIIDMKNLSNEDWSTVMNGSDKPYDEYFKQKEKDDAEKRQKELISEKPENIDEDEFLDYCKADKIVLINQIADDAEKLKDKDAFIELLKDQIKLLKKVDKGLYDNLKGIPVADQDALYRTKEVA